LVKFELSFDGRNRSLSESAAFEGYDVEKVEEHVRNVDRQSGIVKDTAFYPMFGKSMNIEEDLDQTKYPFEHLEAKLENHFEILDAHRKHLQESLKNFDNVAVENFDAIDKLEARL